MRLVQEQDRHLAFGDFEDHLEDVSIGELSFFQCFSLVCELFTTGLIYLTFLIEWL